MRSRAPGSNFSAGERASVIGGVVCGGGAGLSGESGVAVLTKGLPREIMKADENYIENSGEVFWGMYENQEGRKKL